MCTYLPALEPLISEAPPDILQYVLHQFQKTLPNDNAAKKYKINLNLDNLFSLKD